MNTDPRVPFRAFCKHLAIALAALGSLLLAWPALANVGPPSRGGQIVAEPTGLKDVAITRETLTIDLSPLAEAKPGFVEAIYNLDNRGPRRRLDLVFASGSKFMSGFQVWLGDQASPSQPAKQLEVPKSWQPPSHTPGINDGKALDYLPAHAR